MRRTTKPAVEAEGLGELQDKHTEQPRRVPWEGSLLRLP